MIELPYSLVIEATEEADFFGFYSTDSVEDCLYRARWGMKERVELLEERGIPVPPRNADPRIVIQNARSEAGV